MKVDLTAREPTPLTITYEPTGETLRFTFHRVFTRQGRALLQKTVGKGINAREVPDILRMFRSGIKSIEGLEVEGQNGIITDANVIVKIMDQPENMGGLPDEVVSQVVAYLLGSNTLEAGAAGE